MNKGGMRAVVRRAIGGEVMQEKSIDGGIYAHQIRMLPSNKALVLVTRGNNATATKPEDPGALKIERLTNGQVTDIASIAPGSGYGFGPRHVDLHPTKPWMYVSVERQYQLHMYRLRGDEVEPAPAHVLTTLNEPGNLRPERMVGPVHVHPSGRYVYIGNRASGLIGEPGQEIRGGRRVHDCHVHDRPGNGRASAYAGGRHARVSPTDFFNRSHRQDACRCQSYRASGARRR